MSRKTRREKILTQLRRQEKNALSQSGELSLSSSTDNKITSVDLSSLKVSELKIPEKSMSLTDYHYLRSDLLRIFFLTIGAFVVMAGLYFIWR